MFPTENNVQWQATQPSRLKLWNGYLAARTSSLQPKLGFLSESIVRILEQKIIFTENCGAQDRPKPIWYIFVFWSYIAEAFIHPLFALCNFWRTISHTRDGPQSFWVTISYLEKSDVEIIEVCCDGSIRRRREKIINSRHRPLSPPVRAASPAKCVLIQFHYHLIEGLAHIPASGPFIRPRSL